MAELPLRTIKIARRKGSVTRAQVTKALKYAMAVHGQVPMPMPQKPSRKKKAAARRK